MILALSKPHNRCKQNCLTYWLAHWLIILVLSCIAITSVATEIKIPPGAETASTLIIEIGLEGDVRLIANPSLLIGTQTSTHTTALATTVRAIQESLDFPQTISSALSIHAATADSSIIVDAADVIRVGGTPSSDKNIASFTISQSTSATSFSHEPFFARSMASSEGVVGWIGLHQDQTISSIDAALKLTWNFKNLQLQASPIGSLAYIRDMVNIWQINPKGELLRHDEVGFLSYLINDKVTTRAFDLFNSTDITDWLTANFDLSIPLAFNGHKELALAISSTHTQISYEAPPRAVVQVEAAAGRRTTGTEDPQVHWNPVEGTLDFDLIPIDLLLGSGNTAKTKSDSLIDDPLLDGFLEIGTFTYLNHFDDRPYFSGSNLKLLDSAKNLVLTAIAPTLVLEDALYEYQGFNGFAPVLMFEQNSESSSSWMKDFLSFLTVDSLYLPELFIGFDAPFGNKESFLKESFSVPVSALLSFAGPWSTPSPLAVPEPNILLLLCGGFSLLILGNMRKESLKV